MILEFDLGNTRTKWRLTDDIKTLRQGYMNTLEQSAFYAILNQANETAPADTTTPTITSIRAASVADTETEQRLEYLCKGIFAQLPWFARTQPYIPNFANDYTHAEQLGVDRWLAALAAYRSCETACFVIDAGTALTLDYVAKEGRFLGGSIAPGIYMLRQALQNSTKRVRFSIDETPNETAPGTSTALAVAQGSYMAFDGAIREGLRLAKQLFDENFIIFTTGGDASRCHKLLNEEGLAYQHQPELVLDGLKHADIGSRSQNSIKGTP